MRQRNTRIGTAANLVQDQILAWTSLIEAFGVMIGAVVYYNVGMDRDAQPKGPYVMTGPQAPNPS